MNNNWKRLSPVDRHCFGCGTENPYGLQMTFESNGEKVRSTLTIPEHLRGWSNIVHGGVLGTVCDEIMAWAAIHLLHKFVLTKNMTTSYLRPVTAKTTLQTHAYVKEVKNDKNVIMVGKIFNEAGKLCVKSVGEFALFSSEDFQKLNIVPKEQVENMLCMFEEE